MPFESGVMTFSLRILKKQFNKSSLSKFDSLPAFGNLVTDLSNYRSLIPTWK